MQTRKNDTIGLQLEMLGGATNTPSATWMELAPMPSQYTCLQCGSHFLGDSTRARKYCSWQCYLAAIRTHHPNRRPLRERFLEKFVVSETGCWEWTGLKGKWGYGTIGYDRRTCLAHRIAYELFKDPIPQGLLVLHRCDNPGCVNPDHLFLGTNDDNMRDMAAKGRSTKGSRNTESKLTEEIVARMRDRHARGESYVSIARAYGVNETTARRAIRGLTWTHVGRLPE